MRKLLPIMLECMRVARRWTATMIFRLYTSLELQVEAERQARRLWQDGFEHDVHGVGDSGGMRTLHTQVVVIVTVTLHV